MAKCNHCAEETDFPYTCNYCDRQHCSKHRLPEKHNCPSLFEAPTLGPEFREVHQEGGGSDEKVTARVEPGTVGTRKSPATSKSPPVETKSNQSRSKSQSDISSTSTHLKRISIIVVVLVLGIFLFTGYGPIEIGQYTNPSSSGVAANTTETTATPETVETSPTAVGTPKSQSAETTTELDRERIERLIHVEINERRQQHGLPVLDHDQDLREIARNHSAVMAANEEIFHTQPDGDTFEDRYSQAGYECKVSTGENTYTTGGENVAQTWYKADIITDRGILHYDTPGELATGIVNQWMNSTGHRENILKSYWNNEGIGLNVTQEDGKTAVYVTQNFC